MLHEYIEEETFLFSGVLVALYPISSHIDQIPSRPELNGARYHISLFEEMFAFDS